MENKLARSIHDYNGNLHYINTALYKYLKQIEDFYYSEEWEQRLKYAGLEGIQISILQGTISELIPDVTFKMIFKDNILNGSSIDTRISLNTNMSLEKINDSHIENLLMHEFGHIMYSYIPILESINHRIMRNTKDYLIEDINDEDIKYFTNKEELRLRIIPIVKEMKDNNWTLEETYYKSPNLIKDPIYKLYSKEYILYLLSTII